MAYAGKTIESPDTRLVFLKTAEDTDGELLRFEQFVQAATTPRSRPTSTAGRRSASWSSPAGWA